MTRWARGPLWQRAFPTQTRRALHDITRPAQNMQDKANPKVSCGCSRVITRQYQSRCHPTAREPFQGGMYANSMHSAQPFCKSKTALNKDSYTFKHVLPCLSASSMKHPPCVSNSLWKEPRV